MQWSRVKTILIITLLAANLFMAVSNFTLSYQRGYLSRSDIALACSSLASKGITIAPSVVMRKKPSLPVVVVKYDGKALLGFAEKLLGNTYSTDDQTYTSPVGSFQVTTSSFPETFMFIAGEQAPSAKSPHSFVKHFFNSVSLAGQYKIVSSESSGKATVVTVAQTANQVPVRGCGAVFTFENGILTKLTGKWIFTNEATSTKLKLPDAINALFSIAEYDSSFLRSKTVAEMKLVYRPSESPALKNISLNPSLLLTSDSGDSYLFDLTNEVTYYDMPLPTQVE